MAVGSMPYLTRSGLPVRTLRSSFLTISSWGTTCSAPRQIRSSCSATLTLMDGGPRSGKHLPAAEGLEGLTVVLDAGFALPVRPGEDEHVEAGGLAQQAATAKEVQRRVGQAALLVVIHRQAAPPDRRGAGL